MTNCRTSLAMACVVHCFWQGAVTSTHFALAQAPPTVSKATETHETKSPTAPSTQELQLERFEALEKEFALPVTEASASEEELEQAKEKLLEISQDSKKRTAELKELSDAAEKYARVVSEQAPRRIR